MTADAIPPADTSDMPAVHKVFRSSLAAAPTFIASAAGDDARREMIANYYANLIEFLRVHHDGEEELVFPTLGERAPEQREPGAGRPLGERGEAQAAADPRRHQGRLGHPGQR